MPVDTRYFAALQAAQTQYGHHVEIVAEQMQLMARTLIHARRGYVIHEQPDTAELLTDRFPDTTPSSAGPTSPESTNHLRTSTAWTSTTRTTTLTTG